MTSIDGQVESVMDNKKRLDDRTQSYVFTLITRLEPLFLIILTMFVLVGFLSLPISIWWQTENTGNYSKTVSLGNGKEITIDYPAMVLVEDKPAQLSFSLSNSSTHPFTEPLTITVQLSRELILAISSQTYRDFTPVITFQPMAVRVQTQTLQIANARLVDGFAQQQTITLEISNGTHDKLPIQVEGTWRASLRGFFGNQFNLIVTGFLSAAGLLFTLFEKRREAEEKRGKEEAEEKKREKEDKLNKFRELMRQQSCLLAQTILRDLEEQSLVKHIEPDERVMMYRSLRWSAGDLAELDVDTLPSDWLNVAAGALVYAFNQGQGKTAEIKSVLRQLPVDKLSDDVRNAVQAAIDLPEQSRNWPPRPEKPNWDLIRLVDAWKERLNVNPFPYEYAEDDSSLFSDVGAFWGEHPLYRRIGATNKTEIIVGEAGTGKTAMALALGEYLHNSETLACYVSGLPEERDIQRALAKKILAFVCWHPTFLRKLGQDSRALLARVCANALGTEYVVSTLDNIPIEEMEFIKEDPKNREMRKNIIRSQLHLFRDAIVSLPAGEHYSFCEWAGALAQCARLLGFKLPIRVVIDATGEQCAEWINENILPRVLSWRTDGIIAKIFVSYGIESAIKFPTDHSGWLVVHKLEWGASLLEQMLDHRFKSIMAARNSRVERSEIISAELWNQMIAKTKVNPRCFIRLWNRMLAQATDGALNRTVLAQALE